MNDDTSRFSIRNGITIAAEISAVLTLVLTWLMYRETKKVANTPLVVNAFLVVSMIISILSLTILLIITIRALIKRVKKKSHI